MVVCPYYMQGRCRYGDRCYNEHPAGNSNSFLKVDKKIYESMVADVLNAERGKQWPLSCYAPFKDHPLVPNLKDTSAEELRQLYYQASNDNRLQEYVTHVSGLIKETDNVRQFLKTPSSELGNMLENILTKKVSEPVLSSSSSFRFDVGDVAKSGSGSIFGGNSISQSSNIFAQPSEGTSIFSNSNTQPTPSQSIFIGSSTPSATNTSLNVFGNVQSSQNIFANNSGQSNQIFRQPLAANSVFENKNDTENIFQQNVSQTNSNNLFSTGTNVFETKINQSSVNVFDTPKINQPLFNQNQPFSQNTPTLDTQQNSFLIGSSSVSGTSSALKTGSSANNYFCYTPLEELSEEEKAMFMAPKFSFQKIPLRPPPESLCT